MTIIRLTLSLSAIFAANANAECVPQQQDKLVAADGAALDRFGISVSIDGDRAIAGAYLDEHADVSSGSAWVFGRQPDGSWLRETKLLPDDGANGDWFGVSVSISGDLAVVGAQLDDDAGSASGSAYVFIRQPEGTWLQEAKLTADDAASTDEFGHSVAISGDLAVVSSQYDDDNGSNAGAAYAFRRADGGAWSQEQKLTASDGAALDEFGNSVACDGDTIVIGVRRDDNEAGADAGAAYVFERQKSGAWLEVAKLTASDAQAGDEFGFGVAVRGDVAVVGARLEDEVAENAGAAYVFRRGGDGSWAEEAKLTASDGDFLDVLGESVSVSGDLALIGARQHDEAGVDSGAVYLFRHDGGGSWTEAATLVSDDLAPGDFFGISVSLDGTRAISGANLDDDAGDQSGSAYVFDVSSCAPVPGDVDGDGVVGVTDFLEVLAAWGPCPSPPERCPADVAPPPGGDGVVGVEDFLFVLANWT